jgi:hypothetical protein
MSIFSTLLPNQNKDQALTLRVKKIMEKYASMNTAFTEEICDSIMEDTRKEFGENSPAKVMIDTDTNEIEITVLDLTGKPMVFSSLKLFKKET